MKQFETREKERKQRDDELKKREEDRKKRHAEREEIEKKKLLQKQLEEMEKELNIKSLVSCTHFITEHNLKFGSLFSLQSIGKGSN